MAIRVSKGTKLQQTISAALVDIAQIISIEHSGSAAEWFESRTLDGGAAITKDHSGYYEPGAVSCELFYDPALAGHQAITDRITTPADNAMKLIYSNGTEQPFIGAGVEFGATVEMSDGLKGSMTVQVDGDAGWPT